MLSPGGEYGSSLCTLTALCCLSCILGACFPQCTCMYIQNQIHQKAILPEVSFGKAPDLRPTTPASWPVCGPVSPPLLIFRALGLGAGPSWSALQERGLLGDPQSGLGSGWCEVGVGGCPDQLMRTPNAPQPGPLIASRLAGSGPGPPPPGSINSPSLQMAAGSSLASRFTGDGGGWQQVEDPHPASLEQGGPCCHSSVLARVWNTEQRGCRS